MSKISEQFRQNRLYRRTHEREVNSVIQMADGLFITLEAQTRNTPLTDRHSLYSAFADLNHTFQTSVAFKNLNTFKAIKANKDLMVIGLEKIIVHAPNSEFGKRCKIMLAEYKKKKHPGFWQRMKNFFKRNK